MRAMKSYTAKTGLKGGGGLGIRSFGGLTNHHYGLMSIFWGVKTASLILCYI